MNDTNEKDIKPTESTETVSEVKETVTKKTSKAKKTVLVTLAVIAGLLLLLVAAFFVLKEIGRGSMTSDGSSLDFSTVDSAERTDEGLVRYNGKLYKYNDEISCVLLMGVDDYEKGDGSKPHQTDVNVLAVLDPVNERITLIAISRDTMCNMEVYDLETGEFEGMAKAQLALAYSYGDGGTKSCELTVQAVSELFFGVEIPAYASIYLDGLSEIVDSVGGVDVTPTTSFGRFTQGETVRLKGDLTEAYIRPREYTLQGNSERMQRQNQLLRGLVQKALSVARTDPTQIVEMYGSVSDNVDTNLGLAMMVYLADAASDMSFDGRIYTVEGEAVVGKQQHAELYVDEEALFELVLDIFYIPVK